MFKKTKYLLLVIILLTGGCVKPDNELSQDPSKEEQIEESIEESSRNIFSEAPDYYASKNLSIYKDTVYTFYKLGKKYSLIKIEEGSIELIKEYKNYIYQYLYADEGKIYLVDDKEKQYIYDIETNTTEKKRFAPKNSYLEYVIDGNAFSLKEGQHVGWALYYNKEKVLKGVDLAFYTKDYIYFTEINWRRQKYPYDSIERYDIATKKREKVATMEFMLPEAKEHKKHWNDYGIEDIFVYDEYIVYSVGITGFEDKYDETRIYVFNTITGSNVEVKLPLKNIYSYYYTTYYKGNIYFYTDGIIYKYNISNQEMTTVISEINSTGTMSYIFVFDDEYVYIVFHDSKKYPAGFYRVPSKGGDLEQYFLFE